MYHLNKLGMDCLSGLIIHWVMERIDDPTYGLILNYVNGKYGLIFADLSFYGLAAILVFGGIYCRITIRKIYCISVRSRKYRISLGTMLLLASWVLIGTCVLLYAESKFFVYFGAVIFICLILGLINMM